MDAQVFYSNESGLVDDPGLYLQFDDINDTAVPYTEGTGNKQRRYFVTNQQLIDAGLPYGLYCSTIRLGDYQNRQDSDEILTAINFKWDGSKEVSNNSGGGVLSGRIGIGSLTSNNYLEVVQGEQKTITFVVEALGRFSQAVADSIVVKFADSAGTVITKIEDGAIERVCQELDVQILRCTLSNTDTTSLEAGLMQIEISFDLQKANLSQTMKIIEQIS